MSQSIWTPHEKHIIKNDLNRVSSTDNNERSLEKKYNTFLQHYDFDYETISLESFLKEKEKENKDYYNTFVEKYIPEKDKQEWLTNHDTKKFAEWFKTTEGYKEFLTTDEYKEWSDKKLYPDKSGGKKRRSKRVKKNRKSKSKSKRVKKNRKTKTKSKRFL